MERPIDSDQIEQYFRGKLDATATEQLKAAIEQDEQLREAFEWHKDMSKAIEWRTIIDEAEAERQTEMDISSGEKVEHTRRLFRISTKPWLAYAAVGLILIMIGSFWWGNTAYNNLELAQVGMDRLNLENGNDNVRNTSGTAEDPFAQGLTAIEEGNWSLAADFFSAVADTSQLFVPAHLYLAYSHLKGGRYERVQPSASLVEEQSADTRQRQKAQWMIVQASIAQGQDATVLNELLDSISKDGSHMFQQEALLLKKKLASPWRVLTW